MYVYSVLCTLILQEKQVSRKGEKGEGTEIWTLLSSTSELGASLRKVCWNMMRAFFKQAVTGLLYISGTWLEAKVQFQSFIGETRCQHSGAHFSLQGLPKPFWCFQGLPVDSVGAPFLLNWPFSWGPAFTRFNYSFFGYSTLNRINYCWCLWDQKWNELYTISPTLCGLLNFLEFANLWTGNLAYWKRPCFTCLKSWVLSLAL